MKGKNKNRIKENNIDMTQRKMNAMPEDAENNFDEDAADMDSFIGQLQRFGSTETQIVFSTPVPTRGIVIDTEDVDSSEAM
jgi:hypothetical protein